MPTEGRKDDLSDGMPVRGDEGWKDGMLDLINDGLGVG